MARVQRALWPPRLPAQVLDISCKAQTRLRRLCLLLAEEQLYPTHFNPKHIKTTQGRRRGNKLNKRETRKTGQPCCLLPLGMTNTLVTQHKGTEGTNRLTWVRPYVLIRNKPSSSEQKAQECRYLLLPLTLSLQSGTHSSDSTEVTSP